jgi:hypothetical protein
MFFYSIVRSIETTRNPGIRMRRIKKNGVNDEYSTQ